MMKDKKVVYVFPFYGNDNKIDDITNQMNESDLTINGIYEYL
ncbi:hypothetical protein [Lacrimispora sp.]|nr:hypothetical protein [Lacrimispora sp.]